MNPADKYLTPQAPPPTPPRLNTSPALLARRSSPAHSPWSARSARALFGLRFPVCVAPGVTEGGRLISPVHDEEGDVRRNYATSVSSSVHTPSLASTVRKHSPDISPSSTRKAISRAGSPLQHSVVPDNNATPSSLTILQDTAEEELEDDATFVSPSQHIDPDKCMVTCLSSPPSKRDFPPLSQLSTLHPETKPLPILPKDASPSIVSSPLILASQNISQQAKMMPRPQFSLETLSTGSISPTDSPFDSTSPSVYDSNEEDATRHGSFDFGFSQLQSPIAEGYVDEAQKDPFRGRSLPLGSGDDAKQPICGATQSGAFNAMTPLHAAGSRTSFEPQACGSQTRMDITSAPAFDELFAEMGYLGELILGK